MPYTPLGFTDGEALTASDMNHIEAGISEGSPIYGDWTPTIVGNTTAGANTYSAQTGKYCKIGKLVTAFFSITMTAKDAAMAGTARVAGLPFLKAADGSSAGLNVSYFYFITLQADKPTLTGNVSSNTIVLYKCGTATGASSLQVADIADNTVLNGSATYMSIT